MQEDGAERCHDSTGLMVQRSRVGLAIKSRSSDVENEFEAFSRTLDAILVRKLRPQQLWDAFFMCAMGFSANFGVPGSGKTASVLGTFAYLRERGLASRLVVLCPKSAFGSWRNEWLASFGPNLPCRSLCFHDAEFARMSAAAKRKELRFNIGRYDLVLVNYEAAGRYRQELCDAVKADVLLVYDEVHKIKRVDGQWASHALAIARGACRVVALTGTPIPNTYCDLYNLLHVLFPDDYDSYFGFTLRTLAHPTEADVREINDAVRPFFCRTNKQSLGVPPALPHKTYRVAATTVEQRNFEWLIRSYGRDHLSLMVRMLQVESDPAMLEARPREDELEGLLGTDEGGCASIFQTHAGVACLSEGMITAKTRACVDVVSRLVREGKPVIVWCVFLRSMHNLCGLLAQRGCGVVVINGTVEQDERESLLADFRQGRAEVLITNPHTLAESVSLHDVCHDAVYFEYGYNLVHLLQSKDRIHRLGLRWEQYTEYHFLQTVFELHGGQWSLDANIYARLQEKERVMLDAIDADVLEVGATDAQDLEIVLRGLF